MGLVKQIKKALGRGDGEDKKKLNLKDDKKPHMARLPTRYFVSPSCKAVSAAETYGIIKLTVREAELGAVKKGKEYFAVVSIGSQTLSTKSKVVRPSSASEAAIAEDSSVKAELKGGEEAGGVAKGGEEGQANGVDPSGLSVTASEPSASGPSIAGKSGRLVWDASSNFVLQKSGATVAQVSIYRQGRLDGALNNYLVGWCTVDLASYFAEGESGELVEGWFPLVDPTDPATTLGRIRLSGQASSIADLEQQMWRRLLPIADYNGDGSLSLEEFSTLLQAFGCELSESEVEAMFKAADKDHSGTVSAEELSASLTQKHSQGGDFYKLMKRCPIDGAELIPGDDYANLVYISLAMDEGTGVSLKGGFATQAQASRAWMLRMSEWVTQPLAGTPTALFKGNKYRAGGLRTGASAAHILVFDRAAKRVEEERIDPVLVLAMRNMYQSAVGRLMLNSGLYNKLKGMSEAKGKYMDSPESLKEIMPFLQTFRGQINMDEALEPMSTYKNFNQFFYRKLKPDARPIASPDSPEVLVSAADCRLMVFNTVDEATRLWIKGRQFSIAGLLADTDPQRPLSQPFLGGALAVFRLAPQDYHRFHSPVEGVVKSVKDVPGQLYTVNPIAVNSRFANVLTDNKRSVMIIESEAFGPVAYVAIGATMVGSIIWTAREGQAVEKGQELGYFAFGGSTIVTLFGPGVVCWDEDLVVNSSRSLETRVRMGERLGCRAGSALEHSQTFKEATVAEAQANTEGLVPLDERGPQLGRSDDSSSNLLQALGA